MRFNAISNVMLYCNSNLVKGQIKMINNVTLVGNVANEPSLRGSETPCLAFSLAVNEYIDTGCENVYYFDCAIFGNRAKALSSIVKKGMKLTIQGRLRSNVYEKDGEKRYSVSIIVDSLELPPRA